MCQEILRRGATIENTAPDSCVAPRRGALDAPNRGMNPTATIGSSLRDAKGARTSGLQAAVHHACDSQTSQRMRAVKRRKHCTPTDRSVGGSPRIGTKNGLRPWRGRTNPSLFIVRPRRGRYRFCPLSRGLQPRLFTFSPSGAGGSKHHRLIQQQCPDSLPAKL